MALAGPPGAPGPSGLPAMLPGMTGAGAIPPAPSAAPGSAPGGTAGLLGMATPPPGAPDEGSALRAALQGVTYLTDAIKTNPNMVEILAALFQKHPTLRLIWLAASRHPERLPRKAQGLPQEPARVPPLLGA